MATIDILVTYLKVGNQTHVNATAGVVYTCPILTQTLYHLTQNLTATAIALPKLANHFGAISPDTYGIAYTDPLHYGGRAYIALAQSHPEWWRDWNTAGSGRTASVGTTDRGDFITANLNYSNATSYNYTITFKVLGTRHTCYVAAPQNATISYTLGQAGTLVTSGTISPGTTQAINTYADDKRTLVLEVSDFNPTTFQGWTQNGTLIDRWSNPATIIVEEGATYTCSLLDQEPTPEPSTATGQLLHGRYGTLLYAGDKTTTTHTVSISADYGRANGMHNIAWSIGEASGTEDNSYSIEKTTVITHTRYTASGTLLYADTRPRSIPNLVKITCHCEVPEHPYDISIKVDGTTVYQETDLSGTFSRTIELG